MFIVARSVALAGGGRREAFLRAAEHLPTPTALPSSLPPLPEYSLPLVTAASGGALSSSPEASSALSPLLPPLKLRAAGAQSPTDGITRASFSRELAGLNASAFSAEKIKSWHAAQQAAAARNEAMLDGPRADRRARPERVEVYPELAKTRVRVDVAARTDMTAIGDMQFKPLPGEGERSFQDVSQARYERMGSSDRRLLRAYTRGEYSTVNKALRSGDESSTRVGSIVQAFDKAAVALPGNITLSRGVTPFGALQHTYFDTRVGTVLQDPAFISTSFGNRPGGSYSRCPIQMKLHIPGGVRGVLTTSFSPADHEKEIVLLPNTRFLVVHVEGRPAEGRVDGGRRVVHVAVLPDKVEPEPESELDLMSAQELISIEL